MTRIYRYTYRGIYSKAVIEFMRSLTAKDGWQKAWNNVREIDFWRDVPKGPLVKQGLIVAGTRLVKDPKSPFGWSPTIPVVGRGWVWISYNETVRTATKPKSRK